MARLMEWGWDAQHHPRVGVFTPDGVELEPDGGFRRGAHRGAPVVTSRGKQLDGVLEVKVKDTGGSADQKLEHAILSYAETADVTGVDALVVSALCPATLPSGRLDVLRAFAAAHAVAFVALEDLSPDTVVEALDAARATRMRLAKNATAAALTDRYTPAELAAALRLSLRIQRDPDPDDEFDFGALED